MAECWVEPQYGVCCNNTPERQHFNGLGYMDIAKVVSTAVYCSQSVLLLYSSLCHTVHIYNHNNQLLTVEICEKMFSQHVFQRNLSLQFNTV